MPFDPSQPFEVASEKPSFDPSRPFETVKESEASGESPAVQSAKLAISNLAPQATQVLSAYRENPNDPVLRHLDNSDIVNLNLLAQAGKTFPERVGDKAIGAFTNAGKAWQGLKQEGSEMIRKTQAQFQEPINAAKHGEYGLAARRALTLGPRTMRDFGVAALHGAEELAPLGYDLGNAALQASPVMRNLETISPEKAQQVEAALNAGSDIFHAGVTQVGHEQSKFFNAEEGNVASFLGEQAPAIALGGPEALSLASKAPTIATKIVEKTPIVLNKALAPIAKGVATSAPTVAGSAAGAYAASKLGGMGHALWEVGGVLAGAAGVEKIGYVKSVLRKYLQSPLEQFAKESKMVAQSEEGATRAQALERGYIQEHNSFLDEANDLLEGAKPEDVKLLQKTDSVTGMARYDSTNDALSPIAKKIRAREENAARALLAAKGVAQGTTAANISKWTQDAAKYLTTLGITTSEATLVGAEIAGAASPVGDVEAPASGAVMGAGVGLGLGAAMTPASIKAARLKASQGDLKAKGQLALPLDHPLYEASQEAKSSLSQAAQDHVDVLAGLAKTNNSPPIVVLKPDDLIAALKEHEGLEVDKAPNGFSGKDALYINSEAINSGVTPHEVIHGTGIDKNPELISAIASMKSSPEDRTQLESGIEKYNKDLQSTSSQSIPLTIDSTDSEIAAALGADMLYKLPPEALYGGESGGEILKSWLDEKFNKKNSTTAQYGFPVTPEMRSAIQKALFKAGEKAKFGEVKPKEINYPSAKSKSSNESIDPEIAKSLKKKGFTDEQIAKLSPEDISSSKPAQSSTGLRELGGAAVVDNMYSTMFDKLQKGDLTEGGRSSSALKSAKPEFDAGNIKSPADLRAFFNKPEPKLMPSPIDQPASQIDGMIFKGSPETAKEKASDFFGRKTFGKVEQGFLDAQGQWKNAITAQKQVEDTEQMPEGATFKLTSKEFDEKRRFMPAIENAVKMPDGRILRGEERERYPNMNSHLGILSQHDVNLADSASAESGFISKSGKFMPSISKMSGSDMLKIAKENDLVPNGDTDGFYHFLTKGGKEITVREWSDSDSFLNQIKNAIQSRERTAEGPIIDLDLSPEEQRFQELFHKEDQGLSPKEEKELNDLTFKVMGKYGSVENFEKKFPAKEQKFMPAQTNTPEFKKWFGDSKIKDEKGNPVALYHGTTHDFTQFNPKKANIENDWGQGIYLSNTSEDIAKNYAGVGPDLTNRIALRTERIESEIYDKSTREIAQELNLSKKEAKIVAGDWKYDTSSYRQKQEILKSIAEKELTQHQGATMKVYAKMDNPLELGGEKEPYWEMIFPEDDNMEPTGELLDFRNAIENVSRDYNEVNMDKVNEAIEYDGDKASKVIENVRNGEGLAYATDDQGNMAGSEILRKALEEMGYDGIIDRTVDTKFGSQRRIGKQMQGMTPDTVHYVAFKPEQIKSATGNKGTFDPSNPDIRFMPAPKEYEQVSKDLSLRYEGPSLGGRAIAFTDRKTGSTIDFPQGITSEDLASQIKEHREKFIEAKPKDKDELKMMPSGFYSQLERTISELPDKASPDQLRAGILKGKGIKQAELREIKDQLGTSFEQYLKDNPRAKKQDMLDFVRENQVQVKEVEKGAGGYSVEMQQYLTNRQNSQINPEAVPSTPEEWGSLSLKLDRLREQWQKNGDSRKSSYYLRLSNVAKSISESGAPVDSGNVVTKFSQYQLPGSIPGSYREALATLPSAKDSILANSEILEKAKELLEISGDKWSDSGESTRTPYTRRALNSMRRDAITKNEFKSSHWDEPNVVLHIRSNVRELANGKKTYFLEELQSDWAANIRKEEQRLRELDVDPEEMRRQFPTGGTPTMPFRGNSWKQLGLKIALKKAVESNADSLSWTTGEQQSERYDLSKHLSRIDSKKINENSYDIEAYDHNSNRPVISDTYSRDELSNVVGKDLAEKIINGEGYRSDNPRMDQTFSGLDLKVGGEGMKGFYDKELVNIGNNIVKKWGVKVEDVTLPATSKYGYKESAINEWQIYPQDDPSQITEFHGTEKEAAQEAARLGGGAVDPITVHSIEITPQMRKDILEKGQPLFAPSGMKGLANISAPKSKSVQILSTPQKKKRKKSLAEISSK